MATCPKRTFTNILKKVLRNTTHEYAKKIPILRNILKNDKSDLESY